MSSSNTAGGASGRDGPLPSDEVEWVRTMRSKLERCDAPDEQERVFEGPLEGPLARPGLCLEEGAKLGVGSRLVGNSVYLGRDARVAPDSKLHANSIYLGSGVRIQSNVQLLSGEILIEDGALLADGVSGDLSGGRSEDSRLIVGGACLIGAGAYLNTCREIFVERECAVSPRAMIFTHSYWQSVLDGARPLFAAVRLCANSWLGAGCQVLPGVVIGSGSTVVSNSVAVASVSPNSVVGGIPAVLLRSEVLRPLEGDALDSKIRELLEQFAAAARSKGCTVDGDVATGLLRISRHDIADRTVAILDTDPRLPVAGPVVYVSLGSHFDLGPDDAVLDLKERRAFGAEDRVVHELRNFLRRHGIRFRPYAWDSDFRRGL